MSTILSDLIRATSELKNAFVRAGLEPELKIICKRPETLRAVSGMLVQSLDMLYRDGKPPDLAPGEFKLNGIVFSSTELAASSLQAKRPQD
jgi:hypothetical protein